MLFRLFTTAFLAVCGASALAQTEPGAHLRIFSGDFTTESYLSKHNNNSNSTLSVSGGFQAGKFIRPQLAHGWFVNLNFYSSKSRTPNTSPEIAGVFLPRLGAGYFVRRYVTVTDQLRFFAQGTLGIETQAVFFKVPNAGDPFVSNRDVGGRE